MGKSKLTHQWFEIGTHNCTLDGARIWCQMHDHDGRMREMVDDIVGRNAVMSALYCIQPTITRIKKRSQGNDIHDAWQTARYRQTKQINIMLGRISLGNLHLEFTNNPIIPNPIPNYYNPSLLHFIAREQVVFFDEIHVK